MLPHPASTAPTNHADGTPWLANASLTLMLVAAEGSPMAVGIGIDMVTISEIGSLLDERGLASGTRLDPFISRSFTTAELELARAHANQAEFLAGRFAAKEAVFKSLAPHAADNLEFRDIETLARLDGSPYVNPSPTLARVLELAGAHEVLVSITNEGSYAMAMALAQ